MDENNKNKKEATSNLISSMKPIMMIPSFVLLFLRSLHSLVDGRGCVVFCGRRQILRILGRKSCCRNTTFFVAGCLWRGWLRICGIRDGGCVFNGERKGGFLRRRKIRIDRFHKNAFGRGIWRLSIGGNSGWLGGGWFWSLVLSRTIMNERSRGDDFSDRFRVGLRLERFEIHTTEISDGSTV
jgi:hypothetical protein